MDSNEKTDYIFDKLNSSSINNIIANYFISPSPIRAYSGTFYLYNVYTFLLYLSIRSIWRVLPIVEYMI